MNYYFGRLTVSRESLTFSKDFCLCAADEPQAQSLLQAAAANTQLEHPGYSVTSGQVSGVSAVTYQEMSKLLPTLGESSFADLASQELTDQVKTLARRIGTHLAQSGTRVSHNKLLHALSASLGHTEFAVIKGKSRTKAPSAWYPEGAWPTAPLRDARALSFACRVDAIWLTHGDVALAARLLHVSPESLMQSLDAMEADTAFCCRPNNWVPEDSLDCSFGARCERGSSFKVLMRSMLGSTAAQLEGFVDGRSVISVSNHIGNVWRVTSSSCLPSDLQTAKKFLACYEEVMQRAIELRSTTYPEPVAELEISFP